MAEEFDLIGRIEMAIRTDTAGARRGAEEIAREIEVVAADLARHLLAEAPASNLEQLEETINRARSMAREAYGEVTKQDARGAYTSGIVGRAEEKARKEGSNISDAGRAVRENLNVATSQEGVDRATRAISLGATKVAAETNAAMLSAGDAAKAMSERAAVDEQIINSSRALAAAIDERVQASRKEAAILNALSRRQGGLLTAYGQIQASIATSKAVIDAEVKGRLAGSQRYIGALASSAASQQQINAQTQSRLARDQDYIRSSAGLTRAQEQIRAQVQQRLASDQRFIRASTDTAVAQQQIRAQIQNRLAREDEYIRTTAAITRANEQIQARTRERLSGDAAYIDATVDTARAQEQIRAQTRRRLAVDDAYLQASANSAAAQQQIQTGTRQRLVGDTAYLASLAQAKFLQTRINNEVLSRQLGLGLADEQAETKALQARLNRATLAQLEGTAGYAANLAEAAVIQRRINNDVLRQQLGNGYVEAQAEGKILQEQLNARVRQQIAQDGGLGVADAQRKLADRLIKGEAATETGRLMSDPITGARVTQGETAELINSRDDARRRAADEAYVTAQGELAAAKRLESARSREMMLASGEYMESVRLAAVNKAMEAAQGLEFAATDEGMDVLQMEAQNAARAGVKAQYAKNLEMQEQLGLQSALTGVTRAEVQDALRGQNLTDTMLRLKGERAALEAEMVRQGLRDTRNGGDGPGQRRGGGLARSLATTARFGASGALFYGLTTGVAEAVREATELDRILNQIERQFSSQFGEGTETARRQFAAFRKEVFETAELTGVAADQVANVGFQLQGAFGGDTQRALGETRDAIIASAVTGLDVNEVIDSFTALTQSFEDQGLTIESVSDAALQLQEDLGVLAKETITFAADLAPVGAELGFTANQLAAIGAVAQQVSGRSGTALAEAFGRVFPAMQGQAANIVGIFETLGGDAADTVSEAFSRNDISAVFDQLLLNYNRLGEGAQNQLIEALGGRREAQSIIGVLKNGTKVFEEYRRANDAAGKTSEYFADLQETLQLRLARLGEEFKRMVQKLFESGLKDFFVDFIDLLSTALRMAEALAGVIGGIGGALGPLSGPLALLLQGGLAFGGIRAGARSINAYRNRGVDPDGPPAPRGRLARAASFTTRDALPGPGVGRMGAAFTNRFSSSFAQSAASAIPMVAGLAASVGATYLASLDANVRQGAEEAGARLARNGVNKDEMKRVLDELNFEGLDRDLVEAKLRGGASAAQLTSIMGDMAEQNQSFFEQVIEYAPGEFSKKTSNQQAEIDAAMAEIIGSMYEGFETGVARMESDSGFRRKIEADAKAALNFDEYKEDAIAAVKSVITEQLRTSPDMSLLEFVQEIPKLGISADIGEMMANILAERGPSVRLSEISDRDMAEAVLGEDFLRQAGDLQDRLNEALDAGNIGDTLKSLQEEIDTGEVTYDEEIVSRLRGLFDLVQVKGDALNTISEAADQGFMDLDQALIGYESGTTTAAEVQRLLQEQIARLREIGNPENILEAMKLEKQLDDMTFDRITGQLDSMQQLGDVQGNVPYDTMLETINQQLASGDLNLSQEGDLAQRAIELTRERQRIIAEKITDEAQRTAALTANVDISPEVASASLANMLSANVAFTDALGQLLDQDQEEVSDTLREIARIVITTGVELGTAVRTVAEIRLRAANAAQRIIDGAATQGLKYASVRAIEAAEAKVKEGIDLSGYEADIQAILDIADQQLGSFEDFDTSIAGPGGGSTTPKDNSDDAARYWEEMFQARRDSAEARIDLALAMAEGDPVAEARAAQQQAGVAAEFARTDAEKISAQAERVRADRQMADALRAIHESRLGYFLAVTGQDPIKAAEVAQAQAAYQMQAARGEAARLDAMAAQVEADRAFREAMYAIANSQVGLLRAMAEAAGDTVEAARLAVQEVQQEISQARASGAGIAELNNLEGQLVAAQRAERDAILNDRRESLQFMYDMGQITSGQLITYLQSLLAIPTLVEDQRRDIERQIRGLRDQMGQDFQFNLPTDLSLPTAYEVRRFNQSGTDAVAGGYNDNRTITVNVSAQTDASPEQIGAVVASVVGDPSRNGTSIRRYP